MSRKLLILVLLLVMALGVIGPAAARQDKVTITWMLVSQWEADEELLIGAFEAQNPDIDVVLEPVPFPDILDQIQVRMSSGDATPDVFSVDVPLIAAYVFRDWLLPLDDAFMAEQLDEFIPAALDAATIDDTLYAAPVATSTNLLFYNADLLNAAGIEPPGVDDRWTYEYIAEVAPQLVQDENNDGVPDVWGFNWEQTIRFYQLQPLFESLGGEAIGEDGFAVEGIVNSPEWIQAFTYYSDVFNTLKVAPPDDTIQVPDLFSAGDLGLAIMGPWNIRRFAAMEEPLPFEWGVARHPYFAEGEIATPTGSWYVGVNKNTEHADAAKRFVSWMTTGEGAELAWQAGTVDFPAQVAILEGFAMDPAFTEWPLSLLAVAADEATAGPAPRPKTVGYLEYEQILGDAFNDIRTGTDVEQALNEAAERIEREMQKYQ